MPAESTLLRDFASAPHDTRFGSLAWWAIGQRFDLPAGSSGSMIGWQAVSSIPSQPDSKQCGAGSNGLLVLEFCKARMKLVRVGSHVSIHRSIVLKRIVVIAAFAVALSAAHSTSARAEVLEAVLAVPRVVVNDGLDRVVPIVDLSQTIPSADEVRSVPRVREGRVIGFPVRVIRYGLNIYPTSRIVRQNVFSGQ